MARIPIITYKNSVLASVLSIFGTAMIFGGIVGITSDISITLTLVPVGGAVMYWAHQIAEKKQFKLWIKGLEEKGIIQQLSENAGLCFALYQANPHKRTIAFIAKHNPNAAEEIKEIRAQQKRDKKQKNSNK